MRLEAAIHQSPSTFMQAPRPRDATIDQAIGSRRTEERLAAIEKVPRADPSTYFKQSLRLFRLALTLRGDSRRRAGGEETGPSSEKTKPSSSRDDAENATGDSGEPGKRHRSRPADGDQSQNGQQMEVARGHG
jgi:hypothetical protein